MTVHDFGQSLRYSHSQADQPWWEEVYRKAFPDLLACADLRHNGWHQKAGRDRAVILCSGKTIYVDEKVRKKTHSDIALEVWSIYPPRGDPPYPPVDDAQPGWATKPLDCDFLAYAFEPARTCHLFPFLGIRAAWAKHRVMWINKATLEEDGYRWIVADNRRYWSISIAVPMAILRSCIDDAMTVCWEAA